MKAPIIASIIVALAGSIASAAELSVFRVCQDQRVIRTSDGAEAGRVEYIVVDPSDQHVVSTVISGGVVGERLIAVPYTSLRFSGDREITLNEITRERLVSAPVIERTQINASVIEPSIIQRTTTHFSARGDVGRERTNVEGGAAATTRPGDPRSSAEAARPGEARPNAEANPNDPRARANAEAASRRDAEARSQAEAAKRGTPNDPNAAEATKRNANDPNAATNATQPQQQQQQQQQRLQQQQQSEKAKADAEAKQKEDAAQQQQKANENKATKPNRDLNNRATPQADREHNENARPQSEAQPGAERKGAADRNASEETPKGRKPAEENAESSKRPPKKSPEPSAEERSRNDQRNPQL